MRLCIYINTGCCACVCVGVGGGWEGAVGAAAAPLALITNIMGDAAPHVTQSRIYFHLAARRWRCV